MLYISTGTGLSTSTVFCWVKMMEEFLSNQRTTTMDTSKMMMPIAKMPWS